MIVVEKASLLSALDGLVPSADPRRVRSICLSGLQVLSCLPVAPSGLLQHANLFMLMYLSGSSAQTQPLIETNVQKLSSRAQPRVQIVYGQPLHSASMLTDLSLSFAPLDIAHYRNGAGIEAILDHYLIPSDFVSQRLESVTHSFNSTYDGSSYCTSNHCSRFLSLLMVNTSFLVPFPL